MEEETKITPTKPVREWPNPVDKIILLQAVKAKAKKVIIQGEVYFLEYRTFAFKATNDKFDTVFVKPEKGLVPCGEYRIKDLEDIDRW